MKKIFIVSIVSIIVLLCFTGCSYNETEINNTTKPPENLSTSENNITNTKLKYLNRSWSDFAYLKPVKNGAIQNVSAVGLYSECCKHYRSNLKDNKETYFTIHNDKVVAYWDSSNYSGKMTVKEFLNSNYECLINTEPKIIYDEELPVACRLYWETDEGNFAIDTANHTWPEENYLEYTVISYAEYNEMFTFYLDDLYQIQHPENLIAYLNEYNFPIERVNWDGSLEYKGILFDVYSFSDASNRCLLVELEYPYRILSVNNLSHLDNDQEVKEVWRNNKESLYKKASELHRQNPDTYRNIGDLQPETEDIFEFDNQYYQTYVDVYKDTRYIYLTDDDGFGVVGWKSIGSRTIYSLDGLQQDNDGTEINTDDNLNIEKVVIADSGLRIRNKPSEDGEKISLIPNGTLVLIENIVNNWAYITYDGLSGWCSCDYLFEPSECDDEPLYSAQVNATEGLRIRSSAIVDPENILTVIPYNSIVKVYMINGDWAFVSYNHIFGYCSKEYLSY